MILTANYEIPKMTAFLRICRFSEPFLFPADCDRKSTQARKTRVQDIQQASLSSRPSQTTGPVCDGLGGRRPHRAGKRCRPEQSRGRHASGLQDDGGVLNLCWQTLTLSMGISQVPLLQPQGRHIPSHQLQGRTVKQMAVCGQVGKNPKLRDELDLAEGED